MSLKDISNVHVLNSIGYNNYKIEGEKKKDYILRIWSKTVGLTRIGP